MPWRYALTVLPEDDRLPPEELFFLSKVAPMGLDWRTTREEFRQRIGVTRYCDWEVIALPPSTALTDSPLEFRMYAREGTMDLPPEYLSADFMPYDDARKNHLSIERELVATLGSPIVNDAANCLGRRWSFGVFAIDGGTFGVSRARESLLFRTKPSSCLILSRVEPLRGPGGSELWVQTDEPRDPRSPFEDRTVVLRGEKMDSLDTVAERLSRLWNLDVQYHVGSDD